MRALDWPTEAFSKWLRLFSRDTCTMYSIQNKNVFCIKKFSTTFGKVLVLKRRKTVGKFLNYFCHRQDRLTIIFTFKYLGWTEKCFKNTLHNGFIWIKNMKNRSTKSNDTFPLTWFVSVLSTRKKVSLKNGLNWSTWKKNSVYINKHPQFSTLWSLIKT